MEEALESKQYDPLHELDQTHLHNRSQVIAADYQMLTDMHLAMAGENPAVAFAKSIEDPNELTRQEQFVVDAYLEAILMENWYLEHMHRIGVIENPFIFDAGGFAKIYISHEYGQMWWQRNQDRYPESVRSVIDEVLSRESQ